MSRTKQVYLGAARPSPEDLKEEQSRDMSSLIGLDVGTTNTKAVAFDPASGRVVAVASRPTPYVDVSPGDGGSAAREIDPAQLWDGVVACLREVTRAATGPVLA